MNKDHSYGVIPVRRHIEADENEFLLIQHRAGHWGFPKGHLENEEAPIEAAARELAEETGLHGVELIEKQTFSEEYIYTGDSGEDILKTVTYFLGKVIVHEDVKLQQEEVQDYRWVNAKGARELITFKESRQLFDKVVNKLKEPE